MYVEYGRVAPNPALLRRSKGKSCVADVRRRRGGFDVRLCDADGNPLKTSTRSSGSSSLAIRVDGRMFDMVLDGDALKPSVFASGRRPAVTVENAHQRAAASVRKAGGGDGGGLVTSPMPGKVVKVLVKEGDTVEPGRPLVVVEAMKMGTRSSPKGGHRAEGHVQPGAVEWRAAVAIGCCRKSSRSPVPPPPGVPRLSTPSSAPRFG